MNWELFGMLGYETFGVLRFNPARVSLASNRSEFGETDLRRHILERHFHRHAYVDLIQRAIDDVAHHADPLVKFNEREIVRDVFLKTRGRTMADGKGIDNSPAACFGPCDIRGKARRAEITRIEMVPPARAALAHQELMSSCALPVVACLGMDVRKRFFVSFAHRSSTLRITVPLDAREPPMPLHRAVLASDTWRSSHSPRSCRTASTSKNMPNMPV
jgi:hypothetical protein